MTSGLWMPACRGGAPLCVRYVCPTPPPTRHLIASSPAASQHRSIAASPPFFESRWSRIAGTSPSCRPGLQMMTSVQCGPLWMGRNEKSLAKMSTPCESNAGAGQGSPAVNCSLLRAEQSGAELMTSSHLHPRHDTRIHAAAIPRPRRRLRLLRQLRVEERVEEDAALAHLLGQVDLDVPAWGQAWRVELIPAPPPNAEHSQEQSLPHVEVHDGVVDELPRLQAGQVAAMQLHHPAHPRAGEQTRLILRDGCMRARISMASSLSLSLSSLKGMYPTSKSHAGTLVGSFFAFLRSGGSASSSSPLSKLIGLACRTGGAGARLCCTCRTALLLHQQGRGPPEISNRPLQSSPRHPASPTLPRSSGSSWTKTVPIGARSAPLTDSVRVCFSFGSPLRQSCVFPYNTFSFPFTHSIQVPAEEQNPRIHPLHCFLFSLSVRVSLSPSPSTQVRALSSMDGEEWVKSEGASELEPPGAWPVLGFLLEDPNFLILREAVRRDASILTPMLQASACRGKPCARAACARAPLTLGSCCCRRSWASTTRT